MKITFITTTLLIASFFNLGPAKANDFSLPVNFSVSLEINYGEEALPLRKISVKLLDSDEANHLLRPSSKWMEIQSNDKQSSDHFKLLDDQGHQLANGFFRNGKALIDITQMNSGKYLIVVGESADRSIQPLELLN